MDRYGGFGAALVALIGTAVTASSAAWGPSRDRWWEAG